MLTPRRPPSSRSGMVRPRSPVSGAANITIAFVASPRHSTPGDGVAQSTCCFYLAIVICYGARMRRIANVVTVIVALEHIAFLVLEMFFWTHPIGLKVFRNTPEIAASSAVLAANQGLYNGFLAAGLLWSLWRKERGTASQLFFLGCVVVAGIYGGATAKISILFVQAMPAVIAFALLWFARTAEADRV